MNTNPATITPGVSRKIFLSGTTAGANPEYFQALFDHLNERGHSPRRFDGKHFDYGTGNMSAIEVCLDNVKDSDLVILIVGPDYGSESKKTPGISVTWEEYRCAMKHSIPVIVCIPKQLLDEFNIWKRNDKRPDFVFSEHADHRLFRFVEELLEHDRFYCKFDSAKELVSKIGDYDFDLAQAGEFRKQFMKHASDACELLGWAKFLPCSLETAEFMHAHHVSLSSSPAFQMGMPRFVEVADDIGNRQRNALEDSLDKRTYDFNHIMFVSDFLQIVQKPSKAPNYAACTGPLVRKQCLLNLIRLIEPPTHRINLFLCEDSNRLPADRLVVDYDSFACLKYIDDRPPFWFWKVVGGKPHWGQGTAGVDYDLKLLASLKAAARINSCDHKKEVIDYIHNAISKLSQW